MSENIRWNVKRTPPEDKLRDFLKWMKGVKAEMLHQVMQQSISQLKVIKSFLCIITDRANSKSARPLDGSLLFSKCSL